MNTQHDELIMSYIKPSDFTGCKPAANPQIPQAATVASTVPNSEVIEAGGSAKKTKRERGQAAESSDVNFKITKRS